MTKAPPRSACDYTYAELGRAVHGGRPRRRAVESLARLIAAYEHNPCFRARPTRDVRRVRDLYRAWAKTVLRDAGL